MCFETHDNTFIIFIVVVRADINFADSSAHLATGEMLRSRLGRPLLAQCLRVSRSHSGYNHFYSTLPNHKSKLASRLSVHSHPSSLLHVSFSTFNNNNNESPSPSETPITAANSVTLKQKIANYAELSKYRLSALVVLTSGAGYMMAGPAAMATPEICLSACVGTALCAASAGTFNQIFEISHDSRMKRTMKRPLPSGRVSVGEATAWGVGTGLAGTSLLYAYTNPLVAVLGLSNILLYAGPYTFSKRYSEFNTWIGAIVGAVPPVMGWAAAAGAMNPALQASTVSTAAALSPQVILPVVTAAEPVALFSLLFLWQFPHFFSLSWIHRDDYSRGQFAMISTNDPFGKRSADLILEYSSYLFALPIITSSLALTSWMFAVEGTLINACLVYLAYKFKRSQTNGNARKLFLFTLIQLPLLMAGIVFHAREWKDVGHDNNKLTASASAELLDSSDREGEVVGGREDKMLVEDGSSDTGKGNGSKTNGIEEAVKSAKDTLRGLCVHEIIASSSSSSTPSSSTPQGDADKSSDINTTMPTSSSSPSSSSSSLCMKVTADKAISKAASATSNAVTAASRQVTTVASNEPASMQLSSTTSSDNNNNNNNNNDNKGQNPN